jgi:para-nitrobenzyl esterase
MTARAFVAEGNPAYMYLFSYVPEAMQERMRFGAGHGSEVAYVFNNLDARRGDAEPTIEEQKLAQVMNTYWANFAKTGDPNGAGVPKWPVYDVQNEKILEIESDGETVGKPDPRKERLDVIKKAIEKFRERLQARGI